MQAFSFSAPRFTDEDEARELAEMTEEERLEVQQDLYGTHVELEETNDLRERLLEEMQTCLDAIPDDDKRVYLEACQVCPRIVTSESAPIRFLRCENYQPERAAQRLVKYWDYRKRVFQDNAFQRLRLEEGAMYPEDESILRWRHSEILPDDRNGRMVLSHDRSHFKLDKMNHPSVIRCVWYIIHLSLDQNEEYCRRGLVMLAPSQNTVPQHFSRKHIKILYTSLRDCLPVKCRAVHACHPTVVTDLMLPVIRQVMGRDLRRRWYKHCGSKGEVLQTLSEYGLEKENLPKKLGGTWARSLEWIDEQKGLERARATEELEGEVP
mmetsp:Transcript_31625/g.57261  ORF Transcript_31625/g.57261 Transcript_31625/m.57261 type:complete len:323 (+) Transcript_31625:175-1143(+)